MTQLVEIDGQTDRQTERQTAQIFDGKIIIPFVCFWISKWQKSAKECIFCVFLVTDTDINGGKNKTRSLDLSRVRWHFQKKSGRQTGKQLFSKRHSK